MNWSLILAIALLVCFVYHCRFMEGFSLNDDPYYYKFLYGTSLGSAPFMAGVPPYYPNVVTEYSDLTGDIKVSSDPLADAKKYYCDSYRYVMSTPNMCSSC